MSTSTSKSNECAALAAGVVIGDQEFVIFLRDGRRVAVPFRCFPRLAHASSEQRAHFEVYANGRMLHWPEIDEDIEVAHILEGRMPGKDQHIEMRVAESQETYGGRAGQ
jgi:hypothetical protein